MKMKIYSKLILFFLFVCSFFAFFAGISFAQGSQNLFSFLSSRGVALGGPGSPVTPSLEEVSITGDIEGGPLLWKDGDWDVSVEHQRRISAALSKGSAKVSSVSDTKIEIVITEKDESPPSSNQKTQKIGDEKVRELHLYSEILGQRVIPLDSGDVGNEGGVGRTIQNIFSRLFVVIFTVAATLMVVLIAYHGTQMIYSQLSGKVSGYIDAKKHLKDIAIGSALLLLSWVFLNFIGGDLLRPELFKSIISLKNLGVSGDVLSVDITVDKRSINSRKQEDGTVVLNITSCPKMTKKFGDSVEDIVDSIGDGATIKLYYMILYSRYGSSKQSGKILSPNSKDGKPALIPCTEGGTVSVLDRSVNIPVTIPDIPKTIAVFPVVRIERVEQERNPNNPKETIGKPELVSKRSWRGIPWRYSPGLDRKLVAKSSDVIDGDIVFRVGGNVVYPQRFTDYCLSDVNFSGRSNHGRDEDCSGEERYVSVLLPALDLTDLEGVVDYAHYQLDGAISVCFGEKWGGTNYSGCGSNPGVLFQPGNWLLRVEEGVSVGDSFSFTPKIVFKNKSFGRSGGRYDAVSKCFEITSVNPLFISPSDCD